MNQFFGPGGMLSQNKTLYFILAAAVAVFVFALIFSAVRASKPDNPAPAQDVGLEAASDGPEAPNAEPASLGEDPEDAPSPSTAETGGGMKLTIPKMSRVKEAPIPTTAGTDEAALKGNAGIHVRGTGKPWNDDSNVYIAGHRLGFPGTDSYLAFWDLNVLEKGDQILITRDSGEVFVYQVSSKKTVEPTDTSVVAPVAGKDLLTLQTCTLPDYSDRLIVQAEKIA